MDSALSGMVPAWKATPTMKLLVAMAVAEQALGQGLAVQEDVVVLAADPVDAGGQALGWPGTTWRSVTIWPVGVWVVDTTAMVRVGVALVQVLRVGRVEDVEAQVEVGHGRRRSCCCRWKVMRG
jgi:hypothetical protein